MELIGSLLMILALALAVAVFVARPFVDRAKATNPAAREAEQKAYKLDHEHSALLAERDRTLTALQELDFDFALGKVPEEEYPAMRAELMTKGAAVLRALDAFESGVLGETAEERIEAAVASRRADASKVERRAAVRESAAPEVVGAGGAGMPARQPDPVEDMIATRKRAREESAAGFCPGCGKPVQKSDKFCSKCGRTL